MDDAVIGIDLGTFNSCVAMVSAQGPAVLANRGGFRVTPSMVAITESGRRLVGHIAKRQSVTNAQNTVYAAKRLIGQRWDSPIVASARNEYPYQLHEGSHGDVRVQLCEQLYSIPEISAMLLQEMRLIAEDVLGHGVQKAVITVPAHFNDGQRQATKDAGRIAGLDVIRIINEPTAAALAYGFGKNLDRLVAVYDLGGGTFDISVLEMSRTGVFKVVCTAGETFLGGEDFDQRLIRWLMQQFQREHGVDLHSDRMAMQRLKDAAEKAKCELSFAEGAGINLPFIISGERGEALHLQATVGRPFFEELVLDLVERSIELCARTLDDAGLDVADIEDVILVGGMTRMPLVQRRVKDFFEREPCTGVNPDEVVALGAAIQGAALMNAGSSMVLLDVTPHTLGIMVAGGYFEELIPQNTTVPTARSKIFTTVRDKQDAVRILVMQGESKRAQDNALLGEFILTGLRPAPAGEVEVEVTFDINADGIVSVRARDTDTGLAQSISVTATSGLEEEEIQALMREAATHPLSRRLEAEEQSLEMRLKTLLDEVRNLLPEVERVVAQSDFGRDSLAKAEELIAHATSAQAQGDSEEMRRAADALGRTARMFHGVIQS